MSTTNKIRIPDSESENFKFLFSLPTQIKSEFIDAIKNAPLGISESALFQLLREKVSSLPLKKLSVIFAIYISLSDAKRELELSDEDFLLDLRAAIKQMEDSEFDELEEESIRFFGELFNSDNVNNKSRRIESEYSLNEKNFTTLKVVTDIRTVFEKSDFIGSTIVNKLKFIYVENQEEKEIFLSVDENDIESIISDLKEAQINNSYIKNNFANLELISLLK